METSMNTLQIKNEKDFTLPVRAFASDAGLDLSSKEAVFLKPNERTLVKTGVKVRIPEGYVGLLVPRSSLSKDEIILTNSVGIIDSTYRGEILASLKYVGTEEGKVITAGQRIVQLLIVPIALPTVEVVDEDDETWNATDRGIGGFGSTGK